MQTKSWEEFWDSTPLMFHTTKKTTTNNCHVSNFLAMYSGCLVIKKDKSILVAQKLYRVQAYLTKPSSTLVSQTNTCTCLGISSLGHTWSGYLSIFLQIKLEYLETLVFVEGGKLENWRTNLGARTRSNNKLSADTTPVVGFKPGPHWLEASTLTIVPSLLPSISMNWVNTTSVYHWDKVNIYRTIRKQ